MPRSPHRRSEATPVHKIIPGVARLSEAHAAQATNTDHPAIFKSVSATHGIQLRRNAQVIINEKVRSTL